MVIAISVVQQKNSNRVRYVKLMISLNETIDQLATNNSVHWYGHVIKEGKRSCLKDIMVSRSIKETDLEKDMKEAGRDRLRQVETG